jgi:hypothetical protein
VSVVGDWDGDGVDTIGVFDPSTATWYLKNSNGPGAPDIAPFAYGAPGWVPVAGDWDGDGIDTLGVFDPIGQYGQPPATWYLRNDNSPGAPNVAPFAYGGAHWTPVVGDWDGDGLTTIGVVDPLRIWYVRNSNSSSAPDLVPFAYGAPGWLPVAGDWDGPGLAQSTQEGQDDSTADRQPTGRWRAGSLESALDRVFADSVLDNDLLADGFAPA